MSRRRCDARAGHARHAVWLAVLLVGVGACAAPAVPPPLRVLTVGHPPMPAFKELIEAELEACRVILKLPAAPSRLPDDAYLTRFVKDQTEELFAGPNWAQYRTQSDIYPDASRQCALTVYKAYSVKIEVGCFDGLSGASTLIGDLVDVHHPKPAGFALGELKPVPAQLRGSTKCKAEERLDPAGLPQVPAGAQTCIWDTEFFKRDFKRAGLPWDDAGQEGVQFCLLARRPDHQAGGRYHTISLKMKQPVDPLDIAPGNLFAHGETELADLTEGGAIDPARFARQGAERFLAQPAKVGLEGRP